MIWLKNWQRNILSTSLWQFRDRSFKKLYYFISRIVSLFWKLKKKNNFKIKGQNSLSLIKAPQNKLMSFFMSGVFITYRTSSSWRVNFFIAHKFWLHTSVEYMYAVVFIFRICTCACVLLLKTWHWKNCYDVVHLALVPSGAEAVLHFNASFLNIIFGRCSKCKLVFKTQENDHKK